MLEFNKYEDVTHCICGVYRANIVALRRNPRHHRMLGGRHGLRWFFRHFNSSYHYHLCDHPRSLYCKAYGAEYSYLKVALSRFNFPFSFSYPSPLPPVVGWVLASSCVFGSHAHLLSGCCDSPSFHVPLKAPHFSTHDGSSPPLTAHENRESDDYSSNNYRVCMYEISLYVWNISDLLSNHGWISQSFNTDNIFIYIIPYLQVQKKDSLNSPWGWYPPFAYCLWIQGLISSSQWSNSEIHLFVPIIISSSKVSSFPVMKIIDNISLGKNFLIYLFFPSKAYQSLH